MQLLKKWWFYVIVIVILVAFFIPKNAGHGGGGMPTPGEQVWQDKECSCLGFKLEQRTLDGPAYYYCSGIPFSCTCFENKVNEGSAPVERKEILCN